MPDFRGTGHSRNGRSFLFDAEVVAEDGGFGWTARVADRQGRPPMTLGGHLASDISFGVEVEAAVLACLEAELSRLRL